MRFFFGLAFVVCLPVWCAAAEPDPEVVRARAGIERLRALVDAGAVPRAQLERAEAAIADAEDAALLRRTAYGQDLTEEQADAMVSAAARRLDRRKQALEEARKLVAEGVAPLLSLGTFLEELDGARKEYDLTVSRANICRELTRIARAEVHFEQSPGLAAGAPAAARFDGHGMFNLADFRQVETAFAAEFGRGLPVSALGETAAHRALGFDHRNRVDVAVHPDQPEGIWLRRYLESHGIPYFAFRQAVPGKATGAHIHIGPMSTRLARSGAGAVGGS